MRHADVIERLREAAPAVPDGLPEPAEPYVGKLRRAAYTVTDADVEAAREAGLDDEAIFELTIATALAAGLERLETGLAAL